MAAPYYGKHEDRVQPDGMFVLGRVCVRCGGVFSVGREKSVEAIPLYEGMAVIPLVSLSLLFCFLVFGPGGA